MSDIIQINVGTDYLRKIIDENPEAKLKLESMASEKIAEEIVRKVKITSIESIEVRLRKSLEEAFSIRIDQFKDRWKFPAEAKVIINTLVKEAIDSHFAAKERELSAKVDKAINDRTEELVLRVLTRVPPTVKETARTEFLSVLKEVKDSSI